jgi:RND superfamily putative drug exporter
MFERIARFSVRRRRLVLVATALVVAVAAVVGGGVFGKLRTGGFDDPSSESSRAQAILEQRFHQGVPNVVLVAQATSGTVDSSAARAAGTQLAASLSRISGVSAVGSYWGLGSPPPLRSKDGSRALVLAHLDGSDAQVKQAVDTIDHDLVGHHGTLDVSLGGQQAVFRDIGSQVEHDLRGAESIAVPITLVLLVVVFGALVAALLPLAVGGVAIVGTLLVLFVIGSLTNVSIFSINLTTALGLGLAIDYSLFMVSRFREEMRHGFGPDEAVVRTVERAGRTVAFSALTVAVSLSALLVFPLYFLRSFAYAGVAVVLVAAITSVVSLPALLAVVGTRVDRGRLIGRHREVHEGTGFWHRMASAVMRHPVPIATAVIAFLVFLGLPFLRVHFSLPDERVLPTSAPSRVVAGELHNDFASSEQNAFPIVLPEQVSDGAVADYAGAVSRLAGVERVDTVTGSYIHGARVLPPGPATRRFATNLNDGTWLSVVPAGEPLSSAGEQLVHAVRSLPAPGARLVGGSAAQLADTKQAIGAKLPLAAGIIAISTFVLLFLMFGSVVVPLKALVLNTLSLTATFGAMVWIFQEGHGHGFLNFTPTGALDTTTPILMFCIAFGLSMDYEVFLLSRIKEEHDRTGDNIHSVATGLERTGSIVTAAAMLLAVTFLAFATSGVSFIKLFGIGLTVAVIVDATIVRATLVPAFMRLAGEANWWAPRPLRRFYDRFGLRENVDDEPIVVHGATRPASLTSVDEPVETSIEAAQFVPALDRAFASSAPCGCSRTAD